jgi:hypothetical protein
MENCKAYSPSPKGCGRGGSDHPQRQLIEPDLSVMLNQIPKTKFQSEKGGVGRGLIAVHKILLSVRSLKKTLKIKILI